MSSSTALDYASGDLWATFYDSATQLLVEYVVLLRNYVRYSCRIKQWDLGDIDGGNLTAHEISQAIQKWRAPLTAAGVDEDLFLFAHDAEGKLKDEPSDEDERLAFAYNVSSIVALLPLYHPYPNFYREIEEDEERDRMGDLVGTYRREALKIRPLFLRFHRISIQYIAVAEEHRFNRERGGHCPGPFAPMDWERLRRGVPRMANNTRSYRATEEHAPIESIRLTRRLDEGRLAMSGYYSPIFIPRVPPISVVKSTDDEVHTPMDLNHLNHGLLHQTPGSLRVRICRERDVFVFINPVISQEAHANVQLRMEVDLYRRLFPNQEPWRTRLSRQPFGCSHFNYMVKPVPERRPEPEPEPVVHGDEMELEIPPRVDPNAEIFHIGMGLDSLGIEAWPTGFEAFTSQDEADRRFLQAAGKGPHYVRRGEIQDNEDWMFGRKRKRFDDDDDTDSDEASLAEDREGFVQRAKRHCSRVVKRQWKRLKRHARQQAPRCARFACTAAATPFVGLLYFYCFGKWPKSAFKETDNLWEYYHISQQLESFGNEISRMVKRRRLGV